MSQLSNVEVVRRTFEASRTSAPETALEFLDPEVEFDATLRPDGKVWHGHDGVRRALADWTGTWDEWEIEFERYLDAGDDRVVVLWRERGRAKRSGVALSQAGTTVVRLKDGIIVAILVSLDRDATVRAQGLELE